MTEENRKEVLRIILLLAIMLLLMIFVRPGLGESPYNNF